MKDYQPILEILSLEVVKSPEGEKCSPSLTLVDIAFTEAGRQQVFVSGGLHVFDDLHLLIPSVPTFCPKSKDNISTFLHPHFYPYNNFK